MLHRCLQCLFGTLRCKSPCPWLLLAAFSWPDNLTSGQGLFLSCLPAFSPTRSKLLHVILMTAPDYCRRFANDFRVMHPAEGFSCIFTVTQQHDIERFMRYINPAQNVPHHRWQANGTPTAAQRHPSQFSSTAHHMSHQLQFQGRQPQQGQPGQPGQPHLHRQSPFQGLRGGGHDMGEHGSDRPVPQAGSQWRSACNAVQQPSSNGRQHVDAVTDDDQAPPPQKKLKKKQKKAAGTASCFTASQNTHRVVCMAQPLSFRCDALHTRQAVRTG